MILQPHTWFPFVPITLFTNTTIHTIHQIDVALSWQWMSMQAWRAHYGPVVNVTPYICCFSYICYLPFILCGPSLYCICICICIYLPPSYCYCNSSTRYTLCCVYVLCCTHTVGASSASQTLLLPLIGYSGGIKGPNRPPKSFAVTVGSSHRIPSTSLPHCGFLLEFRVY